MSFGFMFTCLCGAAGSVVTCVYCWYDEERLRMWARLIQMDKHRSLDEPPDKPFWRGRKRPVTEPESYGFTKTCSLQLTWTKGVNSYRAN